MKLFNLKPKLIFLYIVLIELISLLGFVYPVFRQIGFFVLIIVFLWLCLKDLRFGVWIMLIELIIGSKGYLFYFDYDGILLSIRIAFWLIILSVSFAKFLSNLLKNKKINFPDSTLTPYLGALAIFLIWGLINGAISGNNFSNIFFDFNNWLYFVLIFPAWSVIKTRDDLKDIYYLSLLAIVWLSIKTFILLFFFSHNIPGTIEMLYGWVRTSGVGEITLIQGGFYRLFFQSHIYNLIALLVALVLFTPEKIKTKKFAIYYSLFTIFLATLLLSFSRSFWVGLAVGLLVYFIFVFWRYNYKIFFKNLLLILLSVILSLGLITAIVKFPYPDPLGGFSTADLLSERAKQFKNEAAVSSRWNLLPELWGEIKKAPAIGQGFGATITYKSNDPRILETNPKGEYTTYAFEWGWLDIWLKIGILGALIYVALLLKIIWEILKHFSPSKNNQGIINAGLLISLISLSAVHFFTPYLNHPLGIGFIVILILANKIHQLKYLPD